MYDNWPAKVEKAYQLYRSLEKPSLQSAAKLPGAPSLRTLGVYSSEYHWQDRYNEEMRAEAAALARSEDTRRKSVLENADKGLANLVGAYALASSGTCPQCRGAGEIHRQGRESLKCPECQGTGIFRIMKVNTKGFVQTYRELSQVWGYTRTAQDNQDDGAITPEEQRKLAQEMMDKAGAGDLEEIEALEEAEGA